MWKQTEEHRMVMEVVRRLVREEVAPLAATLDAEARYPSEAHARFAELGLLNGLLPANYGGVGLTTSTFLAVVEEVARACASTALLLIAQADGMLPILHGGPEALRQRFLERLSGDSRVLTALAATEPGAGSDLLAMASTATRDGDRYVLNGRKCFITNGAIADLVVVWAYTDRAARSRGMSAFVVQKGAKGLSYGRNEDKTGMRGSVNSELFFDEVSVPVEDRIGEEGGGFEILMRTLAQNRLFCAIQAVGIAQGALEVATRHARERVQFGRPIAELAPIQMDIAEMTAAVVGARLMCQEAAALLDDGQRDEGDLLAGLAKFTASDMAMRVTTDAVQILGGYGYTKDFPVERMMRDAKLTQIYTGTNHITRIVAGRRLLRG